MRRLSANYIVTPGRNPIRNGILELSNEGVVLSLNENPGYETAHTEWYNGVLVPGFVNAHTHLELAFMRGKLEQGLGLHQFISKVNPYRFATSETEIQASIREALSEMQRTGTVAAADICNTSDTFAAKQTSNIQWHNFVEVLGVNSQRANENLAKALAIVNQAQALKLKANISPHAPYSICTALWQKLQAHLQNNLVSIHHEESPFERLAISQQQGKLFDQMKVFAMGEVPQLAKGNSSLQAIEPYINSCKQLLLVHNTFTDAEVLDFAANINPLVFWVLCPQSNIYIENTLPPVNLLRQKNACICIGTDSLSSNTNLSVLEEIKLLSTNYPEVPFTELIEWASLNGAKALNINNSIGSFEPGKQPGINLIENFNFSSFCLEKQSSVKRLL
jgi:cytosine/adenosine deaminase-related metal-dependent hydrolase